MLFLVKNNVGPPMPLVFTLLNILITMEQENVDLAPSTKHFKRLAVKNKEQ